jgi:hypothetical protein
MVEVLQKAECHLRLSRAAHNEDTPVIPKAAAATNENTDKWPALQWLITAPARRPSAGTLHETLNYRRFTARRLPAARSA